MSIQDNVLQMLACEHPEGISGEEMASELGVSRASIWKAIQKLQESGYQIEAVRNKGYQLIGKCDPLTERGILSELSDLGVTEASVNVFQSIDSTNSHLKDLARDDAPEYTCVVACEQSKGKGRRGRSFCSPKDSGIYLSILIKQSIPLDQTGLITGAAAVAVCKAIESTTHEQPKIKWVNDVYIGERKICGILTEGSADLETGRLAYAIVGIGVNVYQPESGWPEDIALRAGAVTSQIQPNLRNALTARIIKECIHSINASGIDSVASEYQRYSMMENREVLVRFDNGEEATAVSLGVNDDLSLQVRYGNGRVESLNTGEVSIKL